MTRPHCLTRTILYAAACSMVLPCLSPVLAQGPPTNALAARDAGNRISGLNQALVNAVGAPTSPLVAGLLAERASLLSQLMAVDPARALQLALPPQTLSRLRAAAPANTLETRGEWQGRLEATVADDFEHQRATTRHYLRTSEGPVELFFENRLPGPGGTFRLRGMRLGERMAVENVIPADPVSYANAPGAPQAPCTTLGPQKIAVLMLTTPAYPSLPADYTQASVQQAFFGSPSDTSNTQSLNGFWKEVSYGQTSATGQVFGPFTLKNNYDYATADGLATEAVSLADPTVDFTQFTRIALVFPAPSWGGAAGVDTIGCATVSSPSKGNLLLSTGWFPAFPNSTPSLRVIDHELGHALGLGHSSSEDFGSVPLGPLGTAGTTVEYGDPFAAMGINTGHYAAEHKSILRWLNAGTGYLEVTSPGTFNVLPYEATGDPRALRVLRDAGSGAWLWLEYRQPQGDVDQNIQQAGGNVFSGALVRYEDPTLDELHTYLLDFNPVSSPNNFQTAALTPGNSWSDPYSLLTLTANSASTSGVQVTAGYDPACATLQFSATVFAAAGGSGTVNVTAGSACNWTASTNVTWITFVGSTTGNGNGVVQFSVAANASGNQQNGYIYVQRQSTRIVERGTARTVVSVNPVYGSGGSGQFTFQYDDASGYQSMTTTDILFGISGCHLQVSLQGKYLYLLDDSGQWAGPIYLSTPGGSLANSQCSVASSGSSISGSGTGVQLTLQMSFFSAFPGARRVSASFSDAQDTTDAQALGTWLVPVVQQPAVTIAASVQGAPFSLDGGTVYQAPATFYWAAGSQHTIAWLAATAGQTGSRYRFASWADGGANPRAITVPSSSATYTANIAAQYALTINAAPALGGGATTSPVSPDGFYDAGTSVSIGAVPAPGFLFWYFSGDASGSTAPQTVVMSAPRTVTTNFFCSRQFPAFVNSPIGPGASQGSLAWKMGTGCTWNVSSDSAWLTLTGPASGTGGGSLIWAAAQNSGASRTANITFSGNSSQTITVTQEASTSLRPSISSITPAAAAGLSQTFSVALYDPSGAATIKNAFVYIDPSPSANKCDMFFSSSSGQWFASLTGLSGSYVPVSGGSSISNSICQVNLAAFSFSANGLQATLTFGVSFAPAYPGTRYIAGGFSDSGNSSQYEVFGQYTVAPSTQTISFAALPNLPTGSAPFALSATASSGLAVSYVSNTSAICTVTAGTVTILRAGGCTLVASQGGDSTYAAATSVKQSFTIGFVDIAPADSFAAAINLFAQKGITNGCGSDNFCESAYVTRAQMAIFMVRAIEGGDGFTSSATPYFTDVAPTDFGFKWIQKMKELGITNGCGAGLYCPNDNVTRAQMAIFIMRARLGANLAGSPPAFSYSTTPSFTDVGPTDFGFAWIQRMKRDSVTSGCAANTYCPNEPVTRGQMAVFIMRATFNQLLPAGTPVVSAISPATLTAGSSGTFTITGTNTHFVQGSTTISSLPGVTIGAVTVNSPTSLTVQLTANPVATAQPYSILAITGAEEAVLPNGLTIQ